MLGDYAAAKSLLDTCRKLKPQVVELLIEPLDSLISEMDKEVVSEKINQYDSETENKLYKCYFKKQYSLGEIFIVSLIFLSCIMFAAPLIYRILGIPALAFSSYFITAVQLSYFHINTTLPLNLWLRYQWVKAQIHKAASQPQFWILAIGVSIFRVVLLYKIALFKPELLLPINHLSSSFLWYWLGGLPQPLNEELVFRLALYNYLTKFNKYLAYIGTSLLFMFAHLSFDPLTFLFSIVLIWAYNRYQTIIAPIIIHFANNFIMIILVYS